ncbi:MAG: CpaF family protein [Actinomycetia bacterium]|nr:CpaF family protein [Actinomycetes bacterium]
MTSTSPASVSQTVSPVSAPATALASAQRLRRVLKAQLYAELAPTQVAALIESDGDLARKELSDRLRRALNARAEYALGVVEREALIAELLAELMGLGPLDGLLRDASVTEIMVNGPERVFFEREGKIYRAQLRFDNDEQVRAMIERIIAPLGRRIDEQNPLVNGRLPAGHRVNAVIPPLSLDGPLLTIRKFRERIYTLEELAENGALPPFLIPLLQWAVLSRRNIAVSGGTGSGKTTFLNALSLVIPAAERIITIEDSAELSFSHHPHVVRLEARPANLEGAGAITIRDLVINSLRMRPDRIIVGEVRGDEALEMLQAMTTGHDGSLTTLHANTPREVISRLVTMVNYGAPLPLEAVQTQIAAALDLVVHLGRLAGGRRQVLEICEVEGARGGGVALRRVMHFQQEGVTADGHPRGTWILDASPRFFEQVVVQGIATDVMLQDWAKSVGSVALDAPPVSVKEAVAAQTDPDLIGVLQ